MAARGRHTDLARYRGLRSARGLWQNCFSPMTDLEPLPRRTPGGLDAGRQAHCETELRETGWSRARDPSARFAGGAGRRQAGGPEDEDSAAAVPRGVPERRKFPSTHISATTIPYLRNGPAVDWRKVDDTLRFSELVRMLAAQREGVCQILSEAGTRQIDPRRLPWPKGSAGRHMPRNPEGRRNQAGSER